MAGTETKVIDASALVALLFAEPAASQVADKIRGCDLIGPALLDFEVVNTCLSKIRRQPSLSEALLDAYAGRSQIRIETIEVDHTCLRSLSAPV